MLETAWEALATGGRIAANVARLQSGDLWIYSAVAEQKRRLDALGIPWDLTPGVPAFAAAIGQLAATLAGEYGCECPAAVVARASLPDELILRGTLASIAADARAAGVRRTATIFVGPALAGLGSGALDLVCDRGQRPGHEDLVRCSEVGAPVDLEWLVDHVPERAAAVEHHDHVFDAVRKPVLGQAATSGEQHRAADPVERDPVACGQSMNAADPRHHLIVEGHASSFEDPVEHRDRAVIQRRVAPDQERAALVLPELVPDRSLPNLGTPRPPILNRGSVRGSGPVTPRLGHPDHTRGAISLEVAAADLLARDRQILEIRCANGCVASITASTRCSLNQTASAPGPPNPPMRSSPGGSRGRATRPASELITPASRTRREQLGRAISVLRRHRSGETPVVVARAVGSDDEDVQVTTLAALNLASVDMRTLLIVGSSTTRALSNGNVAARVYTPRRYPA